MSINALATEMGCAVVVEISTYGTTPVKLSIQQIKLTCGQTNTPALIAFVHQEEVKNA